MSTSCPATVHFKLFPHATFSETITLRDSNGNPVDLTNCSALMHVRRDIGDTTPVFSLTSQGGTPQIVLGNAAGTIELTIDNTTTDNPEVSLDGEQWFYDLLLTKADGTVERTLQGTIAVVPGITRPT